MHLINENTTHPNSVDKIIYRELKSESDIEQCLFLQKSTFNLPDTHLISPLFLKLFARNNPPTGLAVGVFKTNKNKEELIGVIIGIATSLEKTLYIIILGVKPEYNHKGYGLKLLHKFKEIALERNIENAIGVYEPLEKNLARLYIGSIGFMGTDYILGLSGNDFPDDKLLIKWDFKKEKLKSQMNITQNINYPIVKNGLFSDKESVLIEIPDNFLELKKYSNEKAIECRTETRSLFSTYLNDRNYRISDCITLNIENSRKSYYLLEKS